jgi:tetratricopeptide (TPR) repeat protein
MIVILAFTGMALYNISLNYQRLGSLPSALKCAREALRIWQTSLPPEHEDIAYAKALLLHLG